MTRFLSSVWALVTFLLLGRAYGAQAQFEQALLRVGRPHEYQDAAIIMAVVAGMAAIVGATIALRSRALTSYPLIIITGLLLLYALLLLALGMHRYEPVYSTGAVIALLFASAVTLISAVSLRTRGEA